MSETITETIEALREHGFPGIAAELERLREENERLKAAVAFYSLPTIKVAGHDVRLLPPEEK